MRLRNSKRASRISLCRSSQCGAREEQERQWRLGSAGGVVGKVGAALATDLDVSA